MQFVLFLRQNINSGRSDGMPTVDDSKFEQ